ncbi:MAG: hypothetical protein V1717_00925 [Candidatus Micrarchaeota archaeon]
MDEYSLEFEPGWDEFFKKLDSAVKQRIWKKILQLKNPLKHRHLKYGLPFFVEEAGGYRIVFKVVEGVKVKKVFFAGDHKQYEKWFSGK